MYLELQKLKMSREWGTERLETKNETTTDVLRGSNATNHVSVLYLEVEMYKGTSISCI